MIKRSFRRLKKENFNKNGAYKNNDINYAQEVIQSNHFCFKM